MNQQHQDEIEWLKNQLQIARKELQRTWKEQGGVTDAPVLAASEEFDALLNRYLRLTKL